MKKGRIIKLTGGLYTVIDENKNRYELKPLGIFRILENKPKVGDIVTFDEQSINGLFPRENNLLRPAIANVDQALLVHAAKAPDFSFPLMDRFLILIESAGIRPVIIISKMDLLSTLERELLEKKLAYYRHYYPVIYFSTKTKEGQEAIEQITRDKVNVLAGQTGAGKSSLLNAMNPELELATDEISKALGRGKHTTRVVELIQFHDGWIADTPGFSYLELVDIDKDRLRELYPDFTEYSAACRYNSCSHTHEPGCAVKDAYREGKILAERYENYVKFLEEIQAIKPRY